MLIRTADLNEGQTVNIGRLAGTRRSAAVAILAVLAGLTSGCEVASSEPNSVTIDTGMIGRIVPGAYFLLSWPTAESLCQSKKRRADIKDVHNGVATYRCVDGDSDR
jgi:hypothetical protein